MFFYNFESCYSSHHTLYSSTFSMEDLKSYINKLRSDFSKGTLDEKEASKSPFVQFETWFKQAVDAQVNEPNAMMLATVGSDGKPSARIVLLRHFDEKGFIFYTNYTSRKGQQSEQNACAAISFFWPELERQVRIEGMLERQSESESDSYFASRPRSSKVGAWVSPQSKVIANRKELDDKYAELDKKFGEDVPRPSYWGGYVLKPDSIEFWQGRPSRLHDRLRYSMNERAWRMERLAP
jgi:pyridoxamine 5'-phosphate oxidase